MTDNMYGLLGRRLAHSLSPKLHAEFADYDYYLIERRPQELADFFSSKRYGGFNVTVPYKEAVLKFCDSLSPLAFRLQCVNTVKLVEGKYIGYNTDYYGFIYLLEYASLDLCGKKVLILGNGGGAKAVRAVAEDSQARQIVNVTIEGENNFANICRHYDSEIIINATPVGMFPDNLDSLIDLRSFKKCKAVIDIIYNPLKTALLLQAEELGIQCCNGLPMLVAQAAMASEIFAAVHIDQARLRRIVRKMRNRSRNIVFVGMPGCGKSTMARMTAKALHRQLIDTDKVIAANRSKSIPEIFASEGEAAFREYESHAIYESGRRLGYVLAVGGGGFVQESNIKSLRQNGLIIYLRRDLAHLSRWGRPLSDSEDRLRSLYEQRTPVFERNADIIIDVQGGVPVTLERILEAVKNENLNY